MILSQINKVYLTFFTVQTGGTDQRPTPAVAFTSRHAREENALEEKFSQNFEYSIDDEHHQQQQRQQQRQRQQVHHHRSDYQQEVRGSFDFIELRTENSCRFRNFAILGKKATRDTSAIRRYRRYFVRWIESAFREIRTYALHRAN